MPPKKNKEKKASSTGSPQPTHKVAEKGSVLIEVRIPAGISGRSTAQAVHALNIAGVEIDETYEPVSMKGEGGASTVIFRATVSGADVIRALKARPEVAEVWFDTPIAPIEDPETNR